MYLQVSCQFSAGQNGNLTNLQFLFQSEKVMLGEMDL